MKTNIVVSALVVAIATLGTAPAAMAASDYYLKIEGVDGKAASTPIAIESWSWGQSNPSTQRETKPRDAASGLATGKRMHKPETIRSHMTHGDPHVDSKPGFAELQQQESVSNFSLVLPAEAVAQADLCAKGKHFPKASLTAGDAVYEMTDVTVAACTSTEAADRQTPNTSFGQRLSITTTVQFTGSMKHQKTGHVTLMK